MHGVGVRLGPVICGRRGLAQRHRPCRIGATSTFRSDTSVELKLKKAYVWKTFSTGSKSKKKKKGWDGGMRRDVDENGVVPEGRGIEKCVGQRVDS
jgi:hypothetical protein